MLCWLNWDLYVFCDVIRCQLRYSPFEMLDSWTLTRCPAKKIKNWKENHEINENMYSLVTNSFKITAWYPTSALSVPLITTILKLLRPRYTHSRVFSSLKGKKKFEICLQWYTVLCAACIPLNKINTTKMTAAVRKHLIIVMWISSNKHCSSALQ